MGINEELNKCTYDVNKPFKEYCNGIQVSSGQYDFAFLFSKNSPNGNRFLGELLMSPEHAKVFANILNNHISQFESLFGEIPTIDPEKMEKLQQEGKIILEGNKNE